MYSFEKMHEKNSFFIYKLIHQYYKGGRDYYKQCPYSTEHKEIKDINN